MDKESLKIKLHLLEKSDSLHLDRQEKYHELEEVVKTLNRQTLLHHRGGKKSTSLLANIHDLRKKLFQLKEEIKQIDHTLDFLNDDEESHHDEILKQLVEATLLHYPESNLEYKKLEECTHQFDQGNEQEITPYLKKYYHHFEKGASLLIQGNKRSLFALLFGRHPKVLLAYEIDALAKEARKELKTVQKLSDHSLKKRLISLLEEMVRESDKKWNQALYEKTFLSLYHKIKELYEEAMQSKEVRLIRIKEHQTKIKQWIEKWIMHK